ncbi:MAG TPA: hypothetical protein DDZ51_23455 [Planctomycetaceae bacterium]|nr:hypothetical protein [Planctomycetaceae bacterium]
MFDNTKVIASCQTDSVVRSTPSNKPLRLLLITILAVLACQASNHLRAQSPDATSPLTAETDLASDMIDGIDRFLLKKIDDAANKRNENWKLDVTSDASLADSLKPHRQALAKILGVVDPRVKPQIGATAIDHEFSTAAEIGSSERFEAFAIRWPVLHEPSPPFQGLTSLYGEGLMLVPRDSSATSGTIIVVPDADQSPEQISGLVDGMDPQSQVARRLAESGYRVFVPYLTSRKQEPRGGRANLTDREYLHRAAFELGRTLAGYEVQMILSLVDRIELQSPKHSIGIYGYGEGGMISLFAAAIDTRIGSVAVSGFFGPREASWNEPIDRNFFRLLSHAGATELAMMIAGRNLVIETSRGPEVVLSGDGGAPAELKSPSPDAAEKLFDVARNRLTQSDQARFLLVKPENELAGSDPSLNHLIAGLIHKKTDSENIVVDANRLSPIESSQDSLLQSIDARRQRMIQQVDRHNQAILQESPFVRNAFMSKLDTRSVEAFEKSVESYRDIYRDEVIGHFDDKFLPPNARSRKKWETDKWVGYEVVLDVYEDVFAYGVLLLPKDLQPGEQRPVVVCQHGLEGRPIDTFLGDHPAYHDFAAKLCENGLIVFAPQNPYLFKDRFRTLQRKAQPIGKTLFSIIVPQHQQILNWLKTQPYCDPQRIAFYGLSYGGKTAMRVPALVTDYCLSICSADFNEWVLKNATTREKYSYMWTGEYEIFEWDLGSTFNYAEMAALICPRPFMVERGHFDGVGEDHWVAYEFAKVRHLYAAKLGIGERTEIEWFVGPHTINGDGSFRFLSRHLRWPIKTIAEMSAQKTDK